MKYIVAFNYTEANAWLTQNNLLQDRSMYCIVVRPEELFGIKNPEGVCVGRWRENPFIKQILQTIVINKDKPSDDLIKLYNSVL
jgi:hypothetical protein